MKLGKKLSSSQFSLAFIIILIICLAFLGGLHYFLNIQYQKPSNRFLSGPVTSNPRSLRLNLEQPDNDILTFQSSIVVSGQTAPYSDVVIVASAVSIVIKSKQDGSFSTVIDLDEGENIINVAVFDVTGDARTQSRTVYYSKEKI